MTKDLCDSWSMVLMEVGGDALPEEVHLNEFRKSLKEDT